MYKSHVLQFHIHNAFICPEFYFLFGISIIGTEFPPIKSCEQYRKLTRREYALARDSSVGYKSRTAKAISSVTCGICNNEVSTGLS